MAARGRVGEAGDLGTVLQEASGRRGRRGRGTIIWAAIAVVLVLAWLHPDLRHLTHAALPRIQIGQIRDLIARWGPWAPLASVLLMVAHTFVPFPADLLFGVNGAAFGFLGRLVVSWIGTMASAALVFGIARALGRPSAARIVPPAALDWVDNLIARGGWLMALAVRFVPSFRSASSISRLALPRSPGQPFSGRRARGSFPR